MLELTLSAILGVAGLSLVTSLLTLCRVNAEKCDDGCYEDCIYKIKGNCPMKRRV